MRRCWLASTDWGKALKSALGEAAVPQGAQGQDPLEQGVHLGDGVLDVAAQDLGHQLLEAHDLTVGLVLVIVVHDGAEEHVVALAVGHVIGAAQGEAHAVDRAAAGLQEGDAGVEAGGDELVHILEPGVLALLVDQLEALEDDVHGLLAEQLAGHGLAVGAQEGLGGVDQRVDGGAGEGLVGQGLEQLRDQAHLVGDDVVGHQAQLGLAAGEHAVLFVLDDGHGDVGALGAGAAGGGNGDDVLLMHHGEPLEVQVVDRVGALAAQQLAQVHDGAAAHGDDAVIAVVGDGVVHGLDHGLAGLAGAELLPGTHSGTSAPGPS